MKPHEKVAVTFAEALVARDFGQAAVLLAPSLRKALSEEQLREQFDAMFRKYAKHPNGKPHSAIFDDEFSMLDWPAKRPGDIGWAYVSIEGDSFVEAVTVVVADVAGRYLIREIEWGRP